MGWVMSEGPEPWSRLLAPALVVALLAAAASVSADETVGRGREGAEAWYHREQLAGDPGGWRSRLSESGVLLQGFYNQYLAWKPTGGAQDGSHAGSSGSYDFFAYADGDMLLGSTGLTGLLHVKGQYDSNVNGETGAISQPIDDADFNEGIYVDELWLQQALFDNRLRVRAGFLEQQTVFDRNAYANNEDRQFMASFLDNDGVVPLPNGFGADVVAAPWRWLELAVGIVDADNSPTHWGVGGAFDSFDSLTSHFEVNFRVSSIPGLVDRPGSYRFGAFRDGRDRVVFERAAAVPPRPPTKRRGSWGFYLSFDQSLWADPLDPRRSLGVFARFGHADEDTNPVEWFWSTGLQLAGPFPSRADDALGVGVYQAIASDAYQRTRAQAFDEETGLELYYRLSVFAWLDVTADFQYIANPGLSGQNDDAVIGALRIRVAL